MNVLTCGPGLMHFLRFEPLLRLIICNVIAEITMTVTFSMKGLEEHLALMSFTEMEGNT